MALSATHPAKSWKAVSLQNMSGVTYTAPIARKISYDTSVSRHREGIAADGIAKTIYGSGVKRHVESSDQDSAYPEIDMSLSYHEDNYTDQQDLRETAAAPTS